MIKPDTNSIIPPFSMVCNSTPPESEPATGDDPWTDRDVNPVPSAAGAAVKKSGVGDR